MLIDRKKEHEPDVLGLSALLITTMPEMEKVVQALQNEGIRGKVKVIIGGAPVGVDFAHRIGADAHGKDAAEAVTLARRLVAS